MFNLPTPSYSGIAGNKRADTTAKEAVGEERIGTARWTLLTHLKKRITEEKRTQLSAWHDQKARKRRMEKWVLCLLLENADGPSFWQSKEILRVPILPIESWPRGYWHVPS